MAASGRPEVASDVIFGGNVEVIEVDRLCKFHDPSLDRFRVIQLHHFVTHKKVKLDERCYDTKFDVSGYFRSPASGHFVNYFSNFSVQYLRNRLV